MPFKALPVNAAEERICELKMNQKKLLKLKCKQINELKNTHRTSKNCGLCGINMYNWVIGGRSKNNKAKELFKVKMLSFFQIHARYQKQVQLLVFTKQDRYQKLRSKQN